MKLTEHYFYRDMGWWETNDNDAVMTGSGFRHPGFCHREAAKLFAIPIDAKDILVEIHDRPAKNRMPMTCRADNGSQYVIFHRNGYGEKGRRTIYITEALYLWLTYHGMSKDKPVYVEIINIING